MHHNLIPVHCNLYPPMARYYNAALSIWLSVDPRSDKHFVYPFCFFLLLPL